MTNGEMRELVEFLDERFETVDHRFDRVDEQGSATRSALAILAKRMGHLESGLN